MNLHDRLKAELRTSTLPFERCRIRGTLPICHASKDEPKLLADQGEVRSVLRRWLWFYLATAVILVVSFGVHFGLPVYRQKQVLDEDRRTGRVGRCAEGGPKWLREKIGNERMKGFDEIRAVSVDGKEFTDATLARLTILRSLRWLSLANTQITDAGLAHLKSCLTSKRSGSMKRKSPTRVWSTCRSCRTCANCIWLAPASQTPASPS